VNYVAAVDATTGTPDTSWNPDPDGGIEALAVSGSTLYMGGDFGSINGGVSQFNAAAVSTTGSGTVTEWNPDPNGYVDAIVPDGGTIYLGGSFSTIGATARHDLAAVDNEYGAATSWSPDLSGSVYAIAVSGGTVYAGGLFSTPDGSVSINNAAAFDASTGVVTSWDPDPNNQVEAVSAASDGTIYLGGSFTTFDLDAQAGFGSFSEAPANNALPVISGTPALGQTLTCSNGTWSGSTPQNYTYKWLRDGTAIGGATGTSYTVAAGDAGHQLACVVTAANLAATTASATSAQVSVPTATATVAATVGFSGSASVNASSGTVDFDETVTAAGALRWTLTFKNGKYGAFDAKKPKHGHCTRGQVRLKQKCGPATIVYSQGHANAAEAGKLDFSAKPTAAGRVALAYALKHHKGITVRATLIFQASLGGPAVTHTSTLTITPRALKHKKKKHEMLR